MVARTRSSASLDAGSDEEDAAAAGTDAPEAKSAIPASDSSFERKIVIARGELAGAEFHLLRHPKAGTGVLFQIEKSRLDEVLTVEAETRSWFYGESVLGDGSMRFLVPYHPLFLILPYVKQKAEGRYVQMEELFIDETEYPAIKLLAKNDTMLKAMRIAVDFREVEGEQLCRWNEEKALDWLSGRFERLRAALLAHGQLHKSVLESQEVLDRYSFDVLSDYLSTDVAALLKKKLDIKEPQKTDNKEDQENLKRKIDDDAEYASVMEKPPPKKTPTQTAVQKRLQQASKGTKSLSAFFTKKT